MKKFYGLIALSLSLILSLFNQGYSQPNWPILYETYDEIIMQNSWIAVKISKATGEISSFNYWRWERPYELLTDTGCIIIKDKRDGRTFKQSEGKVADIAIASYSDSVRAVFEINFGLPYPTEYRYSIRIIYTLYVQAFYWDATLQTSLTPDREANIDFTIPVIANMEYAFWTKDDAPFKLPLTKTVRYRQFLGIPTVLPTLILFDDASNVGLSFVSPFEIKKPGLEWEIVRKDSFIISNYYLRLGRNHPAHTAIYIVPHEGCWRPGLAWLYDKYPKYFNPVSRTVLDGEGWFALVDPGWDLSRLADSLKRLGVKWVELHGHMPFLGLYAPCVPYAPNKDTWNVILDRDDISFQRWRDSILSGIATVSYDSVRAQIKRWDSLGIQTYIYFQSFESWRQFARQFFTGESAAGPNNEPLPAWTYCYLMNPDPDGDWGKHIISQLDALLDRYPKVAGIFYDRDDYCDYDYNRQRNDGVTMIDSIPVYMLGFAQEKINDYITTKVHQLGKGVWTNGPTSIEVCKEMDGIMSEDLAQAPIFQYLGINRPLILLPYDTTPQKTEEKLKTALWTGHFPSVAYYGAHPMCLRIDSNYRPLFSLYKGKKWVLYPHSLQLPEGIKGNIFQIPIPDDFAVPDTDYLVAMIDPEQYSSKIYPEPETTRDIFRYDREARVRVPDLSEIRYAYLLSGDYKGINQETIYQDSSILIKLPAHRASCLIQLSKSPRYEITRISVPVLSRGEFERLKVKIENTKYSGTTKYDIRLATPFDTTSDTFSLKPNEAREVALSFVVPKDFRLGETTMKVILQSPRIDTVVFTSWVVNPLTLQLPRKLFIHFLSGEKVPFKLVNNTKRILSVILSGSFKSSTGTISFDSSRLTLKPLEAKESAVFIKPVREIDTIKLVAKDITGVKPESIIVIRPVERAMEPHPNDFFNDDFSSGNMDKWDTTFGRWQVEDSIAQGSGPLHMALKYDPPLEVKKPERWENYKFQVNTKLGSSSNPLIDLFKSFIYFRVQNEGTYYRFGISRGFMPVSLWKRVNWRWSFLAKSDLNVKENTWCNLRVEVIGDTIKGFVDGNQVISVRDTTEPVLRYGGVGIGVTEDYYVNHYDDVVVRRIEGQP